MLTYKTDKANRHYLLKELLKTIALASLPILFDQLLGSGFISDTYYSLPGSIVLIKFFDEAGKNRLQEIRFDTNQRQVIFTYKTLFFVTKHKNITMQDARLEIVDSKSRIILFW